MTETSARIFFLYAAVKRLRSGFDCTSVMGIEDEWDDELTRVPSRAATQNYERALVSRTLAETARRFHGKDVTSDEALASNGDRPTRIVLTG